MKFINQYDALGEPIHIGDILYSVSEGLFNGGEVIEGDTGGKIYGGEDYYVSNWHCGGQPFNPDNMVVVGTAINNPELLDESNPICDIFFDD